MMTKQFQWELKKKELFEEREYTKIIENQKIIGMHEE